MKIVVCDRCEKRLGKDEKFNPISLKVVQGSLMGGKVNLAQDTKELCDDCYKKALDFMSPLEYAMGVTQLRADKVTAGNIESKVDFYKRNPEKVIIRLERCNYTDGGGYLINNTAWIALKEFVREMKKNETKI